MTDSDWDDNMRLMHEGITALFVNELSKAEEIFTEGMNKTPAANSRDLRGGFALQYAIVSVLKGIGSLENDQLMDCVERLNTANEFATNSEDWVGKVVIRGVCTLSIGVIQCLQFSFVKGVWNILKSWMWIKRLQTEALDYPGKEREVVRSAALFTIGLFNMLISFLPQSMMGTAKYLSGFDGDLKVGLDMLETCYKEDGMLSAAAALAWVAFQIDSKTFLGEEQSAQDFAQCAEIFEWARTRYPNSVFFNVIEADMLACNKDVSGAITILEDRIRPCIGELKALRWAVEYKEGVYKLTNMEWATSGEHFENSIAVYAEVGRRSMVPFMCGYAALCYQVHATTNPDLADEFEAKATKMWETVDKYKACGKTNWGRQDEWAFQLRDRFVEGEKLSPILELIESMAFRMRCTRWMSDEQCSNMIAFLLNDHETMTPDEKAQFYMCCTEILEQRRDHTGALEYCEKGLALEDELSPSGVKHGLVPMLLYLKALLSFKNTDLAQAKASLQLIKGYGRDYWLFPFVVFKSSVLMKRIGVEFEDVYQTINIPARGDYRTEHPLDNPSEEHGTCFTWDFVVEANDVDFKAEFLDVDGNAQLVQRVGRYSSEDGPLIGQFVVPKGAKGVMALHWSNEYSIMRSKTVSFRLNCTVQSE